MIVPSSTMMPMAVTRDYNKFRTELSAANEESIDGVLRNWHVISRLPDVAPGVTRRDMITAIGYALVEAGAYAARYECKGRFTQNLAAAKLLLTGQRDQALKQFTQISAQLYWMENSTELWNAIYNPSKEDSMARKKESVAAKKSAVAVKKEAPAVQKKAPVKEVVAKNTEAPSATRIIFAGLVKGKSHEECAKLSGRDIKYVDQVVRHVNAGKAAWATTILSGKLLPIRANA